ncbi:LOW QUALITY PROTEIN: uncharacterized protein LOC119434485 [Dermacentor silvarum]|nr:uncharacterized protein LOC119434033 [Dermacentor silvarum]XP_037557552.2 uncharacterized protein LOC119434479 [Dermacentor silvarum]XP_037557555.2 uncharacterized protein LOC119434481 [Dermacentor silvarum]XP_049515450.1 LOW QUALITY PROTEIN: uncharacterized protein LOC119434485 [Dermacentor silvarum]
MSDAKRRHEEDEDEGQAADYIDASYESYTSQSNESLEEFETIDRGVVELSGTDAGQPGTSRRGVSEDLQSPPVWALQLQDIPKRRRIVHDVFPARDDGEAQDICNEIIRRFELGPTQYGVAAVSVHTRDTSIPHVHVVHDCSWSNGSCRCVSFSGFVRRPNRSSVWTTSATAWDFFHLIQYLYSHPRVLEYFKVGGADWGRDCRAQVVGQYGHSGHESSRVLEVLHSQFACPVACNDTIGSSSGHSNGDSLCKREGGKAKARKCSKRKAEEPLYDWLRENPVSPLTNIVRTPKWLADPNFRFIRLDDKHLQRAIQVFNDEMCSYTTLDFIELYKNTQPLFDAPQGDLSAYYMSIEESFDAVLELLSFQFDDNQPEISDFVNNLYMLVEKLVPKKNCLEVVSPPSAGKNFFFDAVLSFYINRGTIRNFNRYSNFPLQDTVGRRILVWNEPNCESSAFDTVKKIFGGDVDSVAVKYSPDQTISRTPVIVLSNNEVFPDDDAFNHRMFRYKWKSCPLLKRHDKKVHPMSLVMLYDKYVLDADYITARQHQ